ncbi:MAG: LuxR C-terminal-related transcriptional regulator [Sphaerochaeta sp.]|jgi:DNA-binding NarL/FixJ family response regulator
MQLIGKGCSNKEIMSEVNFSEGTVRNYISNILKKLDLRDRTQIAILAIQSGLMLKNLEGLDG